MAVSLRRRLIAILLGLTLVTWLIFVVVTVVHARQLMIEQIDERLAHYVNMSQYTLQGVMSDPVVRDHFEKRSVRETSAGLTRVAGPGGEVREHALNLWFGRRQVLVGSNAVKFPEPQAEGILTTALGEGDDESDWRILYRHDPAANVWLAAGVDMQHARNVVIATFWRLTLPLSVILPITAAILLLGVGRGLRPLDELAEKISLRKPHALDPIDIEEAPREIKPVVRSLNELLDRLQRALASEHRFTSNAAHELQTPLTAIKAEVQRCQRRVKDEDSRVMLERISVRVSRAATTVEQLLTLARLDPDQEFQRERVDLGDLVIDVMAEVGPIAMDRGIEMQLDDSAKLYVDGNAEWLKIGVRNLLVNALNYSPSPGEVEVRLELQDNVPKLIVANDCEPIPEKEFARLCDRFYTSPGTRNHGSGLGLSIVERIAELHGAELRLDRWRDDRGFRAEVRFPG